MITDDVTQSTHHDASFRLDLTPTLIKFAVAPRRASLFVYCSFVPRRAPSLVSLRSTAFAITERPGEKSRTANGKVRMDTGLFLFIS